MTNLAITSMYSPQRFRSLCVRKYIGVISLAVLFIYALVVPVVSSPKLRDASFQSARLAPSLSHWFGTDYAGHDLFVRVALSMQTSLFVATLCAVSATAIGVAVGACAAVFGRWVDAILMRLADTMNALPHLLLGIVIVAMFRGSLVAIIVSISVTHWSQVARVVRSEALTVRALEYVDAAYLSGASRSRVLLRHILPATTRQASVAIVMLLPHSIWHESTLSFLGLGLSPDQASLGTLLQQARSEVLLGGWWALFFPAGVLVALTLAIGSVANVLRERKAPHENNGVI